MPDKAIDLIDEAASHVALSSIENNELQKIEKELPVIARQIEELETNLEKAEDAAKEGLYREIAACKVELSRLEARKSELSNTCKNLAVTIKDLADVIEIWGVPGGFIVLIFNIASSVNKATGCAYSTSSCFLLPSLLPLN